MNKVRVFAGSYFRKKCSLSLLIILFLPSLPALSAQTVNNADKTISGSTQSELKLQQDELLKRQQLIIAWQARLDKYYEIKNQLYALEQKHQTFILKRDQMTRFSADREAEIYGHTHMYKNARLNSVVPRNMSVNNTRNFLSLNALRSMMIEKDEGSAEMGNLQTTIMHYVQAGAKAPPKPLEKTQGAIGYK